MSNTFGSASPSFAGDKRNLPAEITRSASKQTYYTFRLLVPPSQVQDAYRSYAYFRWVDDWLDSPRRTQSDKLAFIERQRQLLDACYRREAVQPACPEEHILADLIANDPEPSSRLQFYLRNMMAVMAFDVARRGRLISNRELAQYSRLLAMAVTELLFYFLNRDGCLPGIAGRYQAVRGAHIAHMLRDMQEDIDVGYVNLPSELLQAGQLSLDDMDSPAFRLWVRERVALAHRCFDLGRKYFAQVKSLRCRLAAYAYLARFEWMLQAIERDGYHLRRSYPERKSLRAAWWMARRVLQSMLRTQHPQGARGQLAVPD